METIVHYLEVAVRTVISFGFVIGFIATIHEFGHFIIAKACGVRVDEFSLGVGKALWTRQIGDTEYNLRWIPILAYVRPAGMDPEEEFEPGMHPGDRSFQAKGFWAKQAILFGGSLFNFLGTFFILTSIFWLHGTPVNTINVTTVMSGSPAEKAGIEVNDIFLSLDGKPVKDRDDAITYIGQRLGKPIDLVVARPIVEKLEGNWSTDMKQVEHKRFTLIPEDLGGDGRGKMGVGAGQALLPGEDPVPMPFVQAVTAGAQRTASFVVQVFTGMYGLLKRSLLKAEVPKEVGGPVQIIAIISEESASGILTVLFMTASLSVSIGVFNLAPFPALDGGRMLLLLFGTVLGWIARLRGDDFEETQLYIGRLEEWLHVIGFLLLLLLMILVTWKDIWVQIERFSGKKEPAVSTPAPERPAPVPSPTAAPVRP